MGRPRTGTLETRRGSANWHTRIMVGFGDDARRELYDLGTTDKKLAEQRKRHLLKTTAKAAAAAAPPPTREQLKREIPKAETFEAFSARWIERRTNEGVVSARDEANNLRRHVWPVLGDKAINEIRTSDVNKVLDAAVGAQLSRETVRKIRAVMFRVYKAALRDEDTKVKENPVANTEIPKMRAAGRKKERAIPTDKELVMYFLCPEVDPELQMMVLAARVEGGMRTGDVIRWDWVDIDTVTFAVCTVPRSKTDSPQVLSIPPVLAERLRERWEDAGRPTTGPVFPVQRGPRKGEMRAKRGISFAARLRRDLRRAGVLRKELFVATERTLPVDFHSLRRAFVTRLAVAGINVQTAMTLAGHSDHRTHMLYVGDAPELREIPAEVVPVLSFGSGTKTPLLSSENPRATQDSNLRPSAPEGVALRRGAARSDARNGCDFDDMRRMSQAERRRRIGTNGAGVLVSDRAYEATRRWLEETRAGLAGQVAWWAQADRLVLAANDTREMAGGGA
jgi:integrase